MIFAPASLAILLFIVAADQYLKYLVVNTLRVGDLIPVIPGCFSITLTYNYGVAFGMFSGFDPFTRSILLSITTLFALALILYFLANDYKDDSVARFALSMILGGAIGNIIDRVSAGKVTDFILWYYGKYDWPAFNIADSAICVGVMILLLRKPAVEERQPNK